MGFCKAPEISGRRTHKTENGKPQGKNKRKDNGIKGIPQMEKEWGPVWGQRSKDDLQVKEWDWNDGRRQVAPVQPTPEAKQLIQCDQMN